MKQRRQKVLIFLFAFLMFLTGSCKNQNLMKIEEVPRPERAFESSFSGDYKDALLNRLTSITQNLADEYKQTNEEILFVPPETDWTEIDNFYDAQFAQKKLTMDKKASGSHDDYQMSVWKTSGTQAVAIALIKTGNAETGNLRKFLAILLLEKYGF